MKQVEVTFTDPFGIVWANCQAELDAEGILHINAGGFFYAVNATSPRVGLADNTPSKQAGRVA